MTRTLDLAGRRVLDFALNRQRPEEAMPDMTQPNFDSITLSLPTEEDGPGGPPSTSKDMIRKVDKRETTPPSLEEIADRVYHLFCQELRREWERRGRWR
jgi:hypothetical protein